MLKYGFIVSAVVFEDGRFEILHFLDINGTVMCN